MNPFVRHLLILGTRCRKTYCIRWTEDEHGTSMIVLAGVPMQVGG